MFAAVELNILCSSRLRLSLSLIDNHRNQQELADLDSTLSVCKCDLAELMMLYPHALHIQSSGLMLHLRKKLSSWGSC